MRGYADAQARQIFRDSHQYVGGCDRQRKRSGGQLSPSRASADPLGVRPHGKAHCRALVEWITLAPDDLRWPPKYATGLGERLSVEIQASGGYGGAEKCAGKLARRQHF